MKKKTLHQWLIILLSLLVLVATWYALTKGDEGQTMTLHMQSNASTLLAEWAGQVSGL